MKTHEPIIRDFDPAIDIPYLKNKQKRFALISNFDHYNKAKVHISKDELTIDAYCGFLGMQYFFVSDTGFQYDDTKMFSIDEIVKLDKICKKCLNTFKKENHVSPTI